MNNNLEEVKHHPYLGVELSNDLSWGIHINNTIGKAIRVLNFLRRNLYDCPRNIKETAYTAYVSNVKWNTLQQRRFTARQTMLWKAVNNQIAVPIPDHIH